MSNLILPQKWTSQPQTPVGIDPYWINLGAKVYVSPIAIARKNRQITVPVIASPATTAIAEQGRCFDFTAENALVQISADDKPSNPEYSVATSFVWKNTAAFGNIFSLATSTFDAPYYIWTIGRWSDGSFRIVYSDGTTFTELFASGALTLTAGKSYTVVFVNSAAGAFCYINGIKYGAGVYRAMGSTTSVPTLGKLSTSTGYDYDGLVYSGIIFDTPLSDSSACSLSLNPHQLLKAPARRLWVGAAGGTNTAVNPGAGTIAITGYAPSIAQTANQAVAPGVGNIVITGYAPTISQPQAVNPGVGSLVITGYAPTVTQNVDVPINPGVGTIAITGYAPAVSQTANQSITPDVGNIAITGYSPTVSQTANQAVTPDVGTITITGYAPIVQQAPASQNITPGVGTITITGYAPTVEQSSPLRLGGFEYGSKVYIKRNKKIYIFDSVEEADSYLEAEAKVEEIVQQSNKTSRLARKRAREKAHKLLAIEPVESVDIPALKTLVSQLQTDFELPKLIAQQDWQRVVEIYQQAMEMQDEEDLLLIL